MSKELFSVQPMENSPEGSQDHEILIEDGEFTGVRFNFGAIEFAGEDGDGNGTIRFNYDIHSDPVPDDAKERFESVIGEILHTIILEMVSREDAPAESTEEVNEEVSVTE